MFIKTTDFLDGYSSDEIFFVIIPTDNIKRTVIAERYAFLINKITFAVIFVENEKYTFTIFNGNILEIFNDITVFPYELVTFLALSNKHISITTKTLYIGFR